MEFKNILKKLRKEYGLSQEELSKRVGVARSSVANYENGQNFPNMDILLKLSDVFNCTTDYLLGKTNERKNNIDIDKALIGLSTQFNKLSEESQNKVKEQIELLLENEELKRKLEGK